MKIQMIYKIRNFRNYFSVVLDKTTNNFKLFWINGVTARMIYHSSFQTQITYRNSSKR